MQNYWGSRHFQNAPHNTHHRSLKHIHAYENMFTYPQSLRFKLITTQNNHIQITTYDPTQGGPCL